MAARVAVSADMHRLAAIVGVSGTPGTECLESEVYSPLNRRLDGGDEIADLVGGGIYVKWQVGVELAGRRRIGLTPVVGNHEIGRPGMKIASGEDLDARFSNPSKIVTEQLALELEIDQVPEACVEVA